MKSGSSISNNSQKNNMPTIAEQLTKISVENRMGLMTHTVVGYPSIAESHSIVKTLAEAGSDFIELQIPFSDPVADGPTIMRANQHALNNGTTVQDAMQMMSVLSGAVSAALLFMTYYNIIFRYGVDTFCRDAKQAGCAGMIVPDIPIEEEPHEHFIKAAKTHELPVIRVLSPASTDERIERNAEYAEGFVYFAARKGITGAKSVIPKQLATQLTHVKKMITIPVAVGFGISEPAHIQALCGHADVAVVGSKLIDVYNANPVHGLEALRRQVMRLAHVR